MIQFFDTKIHIQENLNSLGVNKVAINRILMCAPKNSKQRKNLEASIISINNPSLNNQ